MDGPVRDAEPARPLLVVVHGSAGSSRARVQLALLTAGVPVVCGALAAPVGREHWARWQRGPIVAVLVDPTCDDWALPPALGARTVVVLTGDPGLPAVVDALLRGASALLRGDDVTADLATVLSVVSRGYLALDATRAGELAGWLAGRSGAGHRAGPGSAGPVGPAGSPGRAGSVGPAGSVGRAGSAGPAGSAGTASPTATGWRRPG